MSNFINTFSSSIQYDIKGSFEYNKEYMNTFLFKMQDYIANNEGENIKNYQGLKKFLGKKRKLVEEEISEKKEKDLNENLTENKQTTKENIEDIDDDEEEEKKYFKKEIEKTEISIDIDNNEDIQLTLIENKNNNAEILTIYNEPISIIEIYDQNTINIDLINDDITFMIKYEKLKKYDFKVYSLNEQLEIISCRDINGNDKEKSFKIQNENVKLYLCIIKSILPIIEDNDMELQNIYPKKEIAEDGNIYPVENISKIFFYYFNINLELQKKYKYIESEKRIKLFRILTKFFSHNIKKILIICGGKGIGKTTSLIRFSFKRTYNIFYFNLETFNKYKNDDIQVKELKIQLNKLFGVFEKFDKESKIKIEIEKYIDSKKQVNVDCLEFIYNIIKLFLKFIDKSNINGIGRFGFIIDQYPIKFKTNSIYDIYKIIDLVRTSNKIKLIICPTINNVFSKKQIDFLFNEILNNYKNKNIDIYYFQELIGKKEMINNILIDEDEEYLSFMKEAGYIPKLFYDSKLSDIKTYKSYLKTNLKTYIDEYLINAKDNITINIELLTLIDYIRSGRLITSLELKNNISKFPLKYLKLIKYRINKEIIKEYSKKFNLNEDENILLKYLSFLFSECDTDEYDNAIIDYFNVEEGNIQNYLDNYFEKDTNSIDIFGNYYENFISKNSKIFSLNLERNNIFLFKLEFSLFLFEDIIYEYLYKNLQKEYNFFINILAQGTNGGFFEILVDYYIKSTKSFIVDDIKHIFYIPYIVPYNYSISYYSSKRKKNDKFIEFKLKENDKQKNINQEDINQQNINQENTIQKNIKNTKKVIPFENTYIKQTIFNSKYYDMIILKKSPKSTDLKTFNLIAIQALIRKDYDKRMTKDEHELLLGIVKQNIENEFDINIDEAYFIYVLSEKNQKIEDNETVKDCNKNGISYIGFDIGIIKDNFTNKNDKYLIDLSKAFITNLFPIHNCASLLIYQKTEITEYSLLKELINSNLKNSKKLKKEDFEIIKKLIKNKYDQKDIDESQFKYFDLKINNGIGYHINDFLTEFCFLIANFKNAKFNKKIDYNCLFFLGKTYDLAKFKIINSLKIENNSKIKFFYSKTPLEVIQNK